MGGRKTKAWMEELIFNQKTKNQDGYTSGGSGGGLTTIYFSACINNSDIKE